MAGSLGVLRNRGRSVIAQEFRFAAGEQDFPGSPVEHAGSAGESSGARPPGSKDDKLDDTGVATGPRDDVPGDPWVAPAPSSSKDRFRAEERKQNKETNAEIFELLRTYVERLATGIKEALGERRFDGSRIPQELVHHIENLRKWVPSLNPSVDRTKCIYGRGSELKELIDEFVTTSAKLLKRSKCQCLQCRPHPERPCPGLSTERGLRYPIRHLVPRTNRVWRIYRHQYQRGMCFSSRT